MTILLTIIHILVCFFLILVVLTQQGKGQDLASAFGGAGSQAAFGARGTATLLTKVTGRGDLHGHLPAPRLRAGRSGLPERRARRGRGDSGSRGGNPGVGR